MEYFKGLKTEPEIKTQYRKLAFQYHPDVEGGDLRIMQEINAQYVKALESCHLHDYESADGKKYTYRYNDVEEKQIIDKLSEILAARLQGIQILLIGKWLWITGNTKPVKDQLKALGLKWHSKRECWYFSATPWKAHYSKKGLSSLADK